VLSFKYACTAGRKHPQKIEGWHTQCVSRGTEGDFVANPNQRCGTSVAEIPFRASLSKVWPRFLPVKTRSVFRRCGKRHEQV
jgi:hypothetical protein